MGVMELVFILFVLEVVELFVQYSSTLKESVYKLYKYYSKSPFIFFGIHFGYIWILFVSLKYDNLSWAIIVALVLKTFDIFTKIELIKKLYIKPDINYIYQISSILDAKIPFWVYLAGPFTYPYLLYLAFT